jgi:hypothetical protein
MSATATGTLVTPHLRHDPQQRRYPDVPAREDRRSLRVALALPDNHVRYPRLAIVLHRHDRHHRSSLLRVLHPLDLDGRVGCRYVDHRYLGGPPVTLYYALEDLFYPEDLGVATPPHLVQPPRTAERFVFAPYPAVAGRR